MPPLKKFKCISKLSLNYFWLCIFHVNAMFVNSNIWKSFKNNLSFESYWHHTCIPSGCWRGKRVKISKTNWIWKKHPILTNLKYYSTVWESPWELYLRTNSSILITILKIKFSNRQKGNLKIDMKKIFDVFCRLKICWKVARTS